MNGPDCLDPLARKIIADGRYAIEPSAEIRDRVQQRVLLRLGVGTATLLGTRTLWAMVGKWAIGTALLGAALAGGWYWRATQRQAIPVDDALPMQQKTAEAANSNAAVLPPTPGSSMALAKELPSTEPAPTRVASTGSPVQARTNDLAAEIELLARANAMLNRGDAGRAQLLLSEYDRKFGAGVLREERSAAGILVLCASGDQAGARAARARFQGRWPRSPLKSRIDTSCVKTQ